MIEPSYVDYERVIRRARQKRSTELGRLLLVLWAWLKPAPRSHSGVRPAH